MPLPVLLILVVGGIAGVALALHLLGLSKAPMLDDDTTRAAWLRAYPDSHILDLKINAQGRVARIISDAGRGLVWTMGADTCARLLDARCSQHWRGNRLTLRMPDFTAPYVTLQLTSEERTEWTAWMEHP